MLVPSPSARKLSSRAVRFLQPAWHPDHPDLLRIDSTLPDDHHARWLAAVVSRLNLAAFRDSYKGYGSLAYPVELLLAFVLFMYSKAKAFSLPPSGPRRRATTTSPSGSCAA